MGGGNIGKAFFRLCGSCNITVEIVCVIDLYKELVGWTIPILHTEELNNDLDAIIVCAPYYYAEVREKLEKYCNNVLSVEGVVNELYYNTNNVIEIL